MAFKGAIWSRPLGWGKLIGIPPVNYNPFKVGVISVVPGHFPLEFLVQTPTTVYS